MSQLEPPLLHDVIHGRARGGYRGLGPREGARTHSQEVCGDQLLVARGIVVGKEVGVKISLSSRLPATPSLFFMEPFDRGRCQWFLMMLRKRPLLVRLFVPAALPVCEAPFQDARGSRCLPFLIGQIALLLLKECVDFAVGGGLVLLVLGALNTSVRVVGGVQRLPEGRGGRRETADVPVEDATVLRR